MAQLAAYARMFVVIREGLLGWRPIDDEWLDEATRVLDHDRRELFVGDAVSFTLGVGQPFGRDPDDLALLSLSCQFLRRSQLSWEKADALERELRG